MRVATKQDAQLSASMCTFITAVILGRVTNFQPPFDKAYLDQAAKEMLRDFLQYLIR